MALAKVGLMSDLTRVPLMLLSLRNQRPDGHYQQTTLDYCDRLRELYRTAVRARRRALAAARRARKQASALSADTFKLTLAAGTHATLPGIALARASLPLAERGDRVDLLCVDGEPGEACEPGPILARGQVTLVNEQQVRIKFQEPLKRMASPASADGQAVAQVAHANDTESSPEKAPAKGTSPNGGGGGGNGGESAEPAAAEQTPAEAPTEDVEHICFKVKFDLGAGKPRAQIEESPTRDHDEFARLIDEVLRDFGKLKCNQALHRNLMGAYDERSELAFGERSRVRTNFGPPLELRLRPNAQQRAAIEQALKRRLALIEGPAGSGKTLVAALVAANACRLRQSRVLVCSPVQATVDKLAELLLNLVGGLQVIKLPENATLAATRSAARLGAVRRLPNSRQLRHANGGLSQRCNASDDDSDSCESPVDPQPRNSGDHHDNHRHNHRHDHEHEHDDEDDDNDNEENDYEGRNICGQIDANRCHLDKIVDDEIYLQAYARSKDTLGQAHGELHAHAHRMVSNCSPIKRREMEAKVISRANVVCCTLVQAASYLLKGAHFDLLILDDLHVTSELDCLVAIMTRGVKQVTLLSDTRRRIRLARSRLSRSSPNTHHLDGSDADEAVAAAAATAVEAAGGTAGASAGTLPGAGLRARSRSSFNSDSLRRKRSTPRSRRASQSSLSSVGDFHLHQHSPANSKQRELHHVSLEPGNLFERLLALGLPTVDMRVQYRCHATLSNFFNHYFYAGRLRDDRKTNEKLTAEIDSSLLVREHNFAWLPQRKYLTALFASPGAGAGELERQVGAILSRLLVNENIQESRIGLIYNRRSLLRAAQRHSRRSADLKQATIDGFIGQERDFIILIASSSQHSIDSTPLGPLDSRAHLGLTSEINCDFRRDDAALNWALTRAKLGLFIVADVVGRPTETSDPGEGASNGGTSKATSSSTAAASASAAVAAATTTTTTTTTNSKPVDAADCGSWQELVNYYAANGLIKMPPVTS